MSNLFLLSAFCGLGAMALASRKNLQAGRITYWLGSAVASCSAFFIAQPQGWKSATGAAVFVVAASVFIAYGYTPFFKIDGRKFSFYTKDATPYGGGVTVAKSWWRVVLAIAVLMFGIVSFLIGEGHRWVAVIAAVAVFLISIAFGYRDAVSNHPIAFGQHLQFIFAAVASAGAFALLYLGSYYFSRRWLMQYQTYGRHDKRTDD